MEEKVYRSMGVIGACNLSIIGGARLFKNQKMLTF